MIRYHQAAVAIALIAVGLVVLLIVQYLAAVRSARPVRLDRRPRLLDGTPVRPRRLR